MPRTFIVCLFLIGWLLACCRGGTEKKENKASGGDPVITIAWQPFGDVSHFLIDTLSKRVGAKLHVKCIILPARPLPVNAFYSRRHRYIADSLLQCLKKTDRQSANRIIGITNADISIFIPGNRNWGIMGLGDCPGTSCIISEYRVLPTSTSKHQFITRMECLSLHELGHTFSLPHCPVPGCIMKDAEGKMDLDDTKNYCAQCASLLRKKGLL